MAPAERSERAAALDGLRAVAALSVLVLHVWLYTRPDPARPRRSGLLEQAVFELRLGLVFFFVLSGYLLYRAFAAAALRRTQPVDARGYLLRRAARIAPAYWVAVAGSFVLLWGLRGQPGVRLPDAGGLPLYLVFGQNYSAETFMRLNPVLWTLCVEVAFYALLPLVGWAAYRIGRGRVRAQSALPAALIAAGLGYGALHFAAGWSAMAGKTLPAYLPHFACGMLVALWSESRGARRADPLSPRATTGLAAAGLALVAADAIWHSGATAPARDAPLAIVGDLPAAAGFAAVVAAVVAGRGPSVAWMRWRPLAWTGVVSYGIYLWHVPVILAARAGGLLPAGFLPALAMVAPAALIAGAASWHLVERPFIARDKRRSVTHLPVTSAGAPGTQVSRPSTA